MLGVVTAASALPGLVCRRFSHSRGRSRSLDAQNCHKMEAWIEQSVIFQPWTDFSYLKTLTSALQCFGRRLIAHSNGHKSKGEGFWKDCGLAVIRKEESRVTGTSCLRQAGD